MTFLLCDGYYSNLIGNIDDYILAESDNLIELQAKYIEQEKIFNSFGLPLKKICIVEKWNPHELKKINGYDNCFTVFNELNLKDYYN